MNALPVWIQVLQGLLTPAIAVAVAVVAFLQWRTAHQKVMLDLFDKRLGVYNLTRQAVGKVMTSGRATQEADFLLGDAMQEAMFLFGPDVQDYLEQLWRNFARVGTLNAAIEHGAGERAADALLATRERIIAFYKEGPVLFGKYMRMDQTLVRTPVEWLRDRNRIRLSYADDKQR